MLLKDMPKLESPFEREEIKGIGYVCVPKFRKEYKWILDKDKVIATEKFDGTNVSIYVENGDIKKVLNRENNIDIWKSKKRYYDGVKNAIDTKKFKLYMATDGQYFGELIGNKIQGNPYDLKEVIWLPFNYIQNHYYFKFYYDWLDENFKVLDVDVKYDLTDDFYYEKFSELFKNLKSIYFRSKGIEKAPEGIVFYNKETRQMCKLRVDMWDWYKGNRHKWHLNKEEYICLIERK